MSMSTLSAWKERNLEGPVVDPAIDPKRPQNTSFYYRLESESNTDGSINDDTESIYSIQGQETDFVKDTSDTETSSGGEFDIDVEIEYDIDSLSEDSDGYQMGSSTESDGIMFAAAVAAACESEFEAFITDAEDSDNSYQDEPSLGRTDYWTCIQCKSQNDNPQFRFCDKCFQDRKTFFPPRPRRHKKRDEKGATTSTTAKPVILDELKSCLNGINNQSGGSTSSQDSGIGSSQELASLCFEEIVVPKHLEQTTSKANEALKNTTKRKRQISESSLEEEYEIPKPSKRVKCEKKEEKLVVEERTNNECKEICIMCNTNPKNSAFLHGRIAHMCCCYSCAKRTWKSLKRCPICNRKVSNIVRVFTT